MGASQQLMLAGGGVAADAVNPVSTGIDVWLKADAITGLVDGDLLSTWLDSGSGSKNATASGTLRPTYKTGGPNGKPYILFNGSSNSMTLPAMPVRAAHSLFWVARSASSTLNDSFIGMDGAASRGILSGYTDGVWAWYDSSQTTIETISTTLFKVISEKIGNSSSSYAWILGDHSFSGAQWGGELCELIAYDTALGTTDYDGVRAYLTSKYAL